MRATKILLMLSAVTVLMAGCSSHPSTPGEERPSADPWEPLNRQLQGFNHGLDTVTFKPVAKGYRAIIPQFIRTGVSSFSLNLRGRELRNGVAEL